MGREILEIFRDDCRSLGFQGSGNYMGIVRVRKADTGRGKMLKIRDLGFLKGIAHAGDRSCGKSRSFIRPTALAEQHLGDSRFCFDQHRC